jgi:hypothetical protein
VPLNVQKVVKMHGVIIIIIYKKTLVDRRVVYPFGGMKGGSVVLHCDEDDDLQ